MSIDPGAHIHETAIIEPGARIARGCRIGAFCTVGADVVLHEEVELKSHAVITGRTEVGEGSVIHSFAVVGEVPQDLKYEGEPTRLVIGKRNRIREGATLNVGTRGGGGITRVGDDCLFMTGAHVAHDAQVGNRVIMANQSALAGHCIVEDDVIIGGLCGVHQFVRIGRGAIIGALSMVAHDVIPHALVQGPRGQLEGLNLVGLRRRGVAREDIAALREAYKALAEGEGAFQERARKLREESSSEPVREIADFILAGSDRAFLTPR